jgi:hypothetical protein
MAASGQGFQKEKVMTKLQVDLSFQSKLTDLSRPLEVCDATGRTLGYFLPVSEHERLRQVEADHQRLLYAWAQAQFSEEELAKAEQESEEFTTEEVLKQLRQP